MLSSSYKTFSVIIAIALQGVVAVLVFLIIMTGNLSPISGNNRLINFELLDGWNEYYSQRQLYKFEYPVDWQITELPDGSILVINTTNNESTPFYISVRNDLFQELKYELSFDKSITLVHEQETAIKGYATRELGFNTAVGGNESVFFVPIGKGEALAIRMNPDDITHRQILETIEFVR